MPSVDGRGQRMVNGEPFEVHGDQWCCAQCHALSDPDCHDRLTRYAEAVGLSDQTGWVDSQDALTVASAVMAVADAEMAELRAEVERLEAEVDSAQEHVAYHLRDYSLNSELTGDLAVDMAAYSGRLRIRAEAAERALAAKTPLVTITAKQYAEALREAEARALREAAAEIRGQYTCVPSLRSKDDLECVAFEDAIRYLQATADEIDGGGK